MIFDSAKNISYYKYRRTTIYKEEIILKKRIKELLKEYLLILGILTIVLFLMVGGYIFFDKLMQMIETALG